MDGIGELRTLLGDDAVALDGPTLARYAGDQTENPEGSPDAVVRVPDLARLQQVVALAARHRVPLIPRVAGTNLGGLTIPSHGGWVLDLAGMNRIVELDAEDMVAVI